MNYLNLVKKLKSVEQEHLLIYWEILKPAEKTLLTNQIEQLDTQLFLEQQKLLHNQQKAPADLTPLKNYAHNGSTQDALLGQKVIGDGCLGCLIIAGGQGTRLKFKGPKGMFPISPVKHKTLFQIFAEKTLAAGFRAGKQLPLAIMTSPENHDQTVNYFKENDFFGLNSKQVRFFSQSILPFLDQKGNLFLESPCKIAQGPDGNGSALTHFVRSGIWDDWYANDVRFLNLILVDNALADPFDDELLGFHYRRGNDITIKCTQRVHADEKVGVLTGDNQHIQVVEYMELPPEEQTAVLEDGTLKHHCANLSLFCMNMEFVQEVANIETLPLHTAYKSAKVVNPEGITVMSESPNAWKYERFIFDILPYAHKVGALMVPREQCFAPLKNAEGEGNPSSVKAALQAHDSHVLAKITGLPSPTWHFELSQEFHYPTHELLSNWKGKTPPHVDYITP